MFNILGVVIADDEKKICALIEYLIDWEGIGLRLLGTAFDGLSALELVKEKGADILLTDIRMPGMDGLELVASVRRECPDTKCIIISGFKDFEYAQQGLRYGVADYLLKPVNQEELCNSLRKIVAEAEKNKPAGLEMLSRQLEDFSRDLRKVTLKSLITSELKDDIEEFVAQIALSELQELSDADSRFIFIRPDLADGRDRSGFSMLTEKALDMIRLTVSEQDCLCLTESSSEGIFLLISAGDLSRNAMLHLVGRIRERILSLKDIFEGVSVTVVIGNRAEDTTQAARQLYRVRMAAENRVLLGPNQIIELPGEVSGEKSGLMDRLSKYVSEADSGSGLHDDERLRTFVDGMRELILSVPDVTGREVRVGTAAAYENLALRLKSIDSSIDVKEAVGRYLDLYEHCTGLDAAMECFAGSFRELRNEVVENLKSREIKPIKYARQYIEKNCCSNISLEELAAGVGFSYSYFSSLFKKETGKTITEYVQFMRMEEAKKLLLSGDGRISEVAGKVGYTDIKTFNRLFRRTVGVSPSEFRKMFS